MLIVCPNCAKSYHIARETIGAAGRELQCSKCFSRWRCETVEEAANLWGIGLDDGVPVIEAAAASHAHVDTYAVLYGANRKPQRPSPRVMKPMPTGRSAGGQLAACSLVLAVAMGAVASREAIVARLPQSGMAFAAIGLPVNTQGIEFGPLQAKLDQTSGGVLSIEGTVTNLRARTTAVPEIVASLKGPDGREVYAWRTKVAKTNLGAGESASFRTRLATPPANAQKIVLRFASVDESAKTADIIK